MQIEKAYLFARQISGGATPPTGNVYFENGLFNPALAYDNTSFSYESITRGDFNDYNNGGRMVVYNIVKNDIGNGKIFQFLGTNAGQFQIVGNNIVCDIATPNLDGETRFSTDFGLLYLPVRLPANTYSKLCGRFKLHNKIGNAFNIHMYVAKASETYGMYSQIWVYDFSDTVDVAFDLVTNTTSLSWDDAPYIGIAVGNCKTTEIEKIWFE